MMLIIIFFQNKFHLYCTNALVISDTLIIRGVEYTIETNSKENNGFIGFFDWLRSDKANIVGVRICFFEHQNYYDFLSKLPYLKASFDKRCMELLFDGESYISENSGDQDFTNNFVYQSSDNNYLYTFGLDHLTNEELTSLLKHCQQL